VLYVTGEESVRQIKLRAVRLNVPEDNISLVAESDVDEICGLIEFHEAGSCGHRLHPDDALHRYFLPRRARSARSRKARPAF